MISLFINSFTSGGAERIVLTLIDNLLADGKKVDLYLIEKEQFYDIPENVPTWFLSPHQSLDKNLWQLPYLFIGAWRLKKQVKKTGSPIVQSHLPRANSTNVLARLMGSPHHAQLVVHSMVKFDNRNPVYRFFAKWLLRQVFNRADSLVFISEVMKIELNEYYQLSNPSRQRVIHNPHILSEIQEKAAKPITDFTFEKHKTYLIYAGRFAKSKRVADLIEGFNKLHSQMPQLELLLVGQGKEEKRLRKRSRELKLESRIHFLGYQSNPYPYIAGADILILPSEKEGLPNILIEAMACGTPVISSDCQSGPREILSPGSDLKVQLKQKIEEAAYGILYPVGNIDLLATAIISMLCSEKVYDLYVEKGKSRARDFDAAKISKAYIELINDIAIKNREKLAWQQE